MLERLTVKPDGVLPTRLDIGTLAEALLFYDCVQVDADATILQDLLGTVDVGAIVELLKSGALMLRPLQQMYGVRTYGSGTSAERHNVVRIAPASSTPERLLRVLGHKMPTPEAQRIVDAVLPHIDVIEDQTPPPNVDFSEIDWSIRSTADLVRALVEFAAPGYVLPNPVVFNVFRVESMITVETNLDFVAATPFYVANPQFGEGRTAFGCADVLGWLSRIHGRLRGAAEARTDVVLGTSERLLEEAFLQKVLGAGLELDSRVLEFQDVILGNGHAIAEAVNSGARTFPEFLKVYERSRRFRDWLRDRAPDADLLNSYYASATAETWVDKLPPKAVRWSVLQAVGLAIDALAKGAPVGTAVVTAINLTDTFLLDRFLRGWRPSYFVSGELTKFTKGGTPK